MMIDQPSNSLTHVQAGKVRALAVTAPTRMAAAPDIPTTDEAGLPGFYTSLWYGLWVPKDTPKEIIAKLNAAVVDALGAPTISADHDETVVGDDTLLTVDQAAVRLGVSTDWLFRRSRTLPFVVRLGRHLRFSNRGIDRYLRNRTGR
jgi:excisionase family DNA binding protein